jgi:single-stranded-DNA-specific exonuclease
MAELGAADVPAWASRLRIVQRGTVAAGETPAWGALHPVLARAYRARGVASPGELALTLDRLLPVGSLDNVADAAELLLSHRARRVLVIGDFDADGATSTALIVRALRAWGFSDVDFLVPNRFEYGYGLTPEIVALAAQRAPSLIVTVDNGISSMAGVDAARAAGIEVLVTDHHLPGATLPAAQVIVNPNVAGANFGSRALAGVGVAFYVMAALQRRMAELGQLPANAPTAADFLDLVALGTVADVVPLDVNNRILVAQGLRRIRAGRCGAGIRALLEVAGRNLAQLTAADLGFAVGPRLNAAGRLDDMSIGIRCLLADTPTEAAMLAARLDQLNQERRAIEARMQETAIAAVRGLRDAEIGALDGGRRRAAVCLYDPSWHQGVVGLVASRIKERLRRPVVAFADNADGTLRGSARSIAGVHVRDVFDAVAAHHPGLLVRFGGHAMAAGLTLERARLDEFARAFEAEVERAMAGALLADAVESDGPLAVEEISLSTAEALREGGPWGQGFPEPVFDGEFAITRTRQVGERHLKMWVEVPGTGRRFDAIAFNLLEPGREAGRVPPRARLVYRLDINEYAGERRLQLLIDHLLAAAPA